jgi:hypothetical protein
VTKEQLPITKIVWDPKIYPRAKWSAATIDRYSDALDAGDEFPPLVLESDTNRLLDGKHRLEAYRKNHERAGASESKAAVDYGTCLVPVEWHEIPDGMSPKLYAAKLSARHGDRMSNGDLKALAVEMCEADPKGFKVDDFMRAMGVARSTVYDWVGHILSRDTEQRQGTVIRLSMLGWTQAEIGARLGVDRTTVSVDVKKSETGLSNIRALRAGGTERHEIARRFNMHPTLIEAITLDGLDDEARLKKLGIKTQPYDVWQFPGCHDLMGDAHPGRIPGELLAHVLYFFTNPGDLVVDPMAGSGTTLDACLLMGRKARGYDIDGRHERFDVEAHDLSTGWPDTVGKASLVFWDPPYFDKMDSSTIGEDGYIDGSVSKLSPDDYLEFFAKRFTELHEAARPGTVLAFLMSDWDPQNAKRHHDHPGIFMWDYVDRLRDAGWHLQRQIQVPLSTQQVHADIVNKFRESRRLARLERYLVIARA